MTTRPVALDTSDVPPRTGSAYPEEFQSVVLPREKRALGDAFGLTQFGVNLTTIAPGRASSLRHRHRTEDELIYVLDGELVLVTDAGETRLVAGMCAGFPAGSGDAHQLVNRSGSPARVLEVGTRAAEDDVVYPDVDLAASKRPGGSWVFTRADGTPR